MSGASRRLPALDGLRGIAIVAVLAWHYVSCISPWDQTWGEVARAALAYAWTGVDLFFVLSGFLVGGIVLDQRRSPNFLRVFYARRALRILPLYWAVLSVFVASGALLAPRLAEPAREWLHGNPHSLVTYLAFAQNFVTGLFTPHLPEPGWVNVTWSLAVEEHFYLVVPLAMLVTPARAIPWALAAVVAAGPFARWATMARLGEGPVYVLTFCRVDAIFLGVLCAWAVRRPWFGAVFTRARLYAGASAVLAVAVATRFFDVGRMFSVVAYSGFAVLYACVLLLAVTEARGPLAAVLRARPLQRAGVLAYGLYLLHQPVNGLAHALVTGGAPSLSTRRGVVATCAAFIATWLLAELSWRVLERPIVRIGQRLHYRPPATDRAANDAVADPEIATLRAG